MGRAFRQKQSTYGKCMCLHLYSLKSCEYWLACARNQSPENAHKPGMLIRYTHTEPRMLRSEIRRAPHVVAEHCRAHLPGATNQVCSPAAIDDTRPYQFRLTNAPLGMVRHGKKESNRKLGTDDLRAKPGSVQ